MRKRKAAPAGPTLPPKLRRRRGTLLRLREALCGGGAAPYFELLGRLSLLLLLCGTVLALTRWARGAPGLACCSLLHAPAARLLACANTTAARPSLPLLPHPKAQRARCVPHAPVVDIRSLPRSVLVVTQVAGAVLRYAAPAAAVNSLWASRQGYRYLIRGDVALPPRYDPRYGKVALLLQALRTQQSGWLLWLDADAVVVNHEWRVEALTDSVDNSVQLVVCAEANMETNTRMNSGTMLVRASPWSNAFFQAWWDHPDAGIGAPDQWTFDALWEVDEMEVQAHTRILPATSFNSEPPFYSTFSSVAAQPVIHLMGDADEVRLRLFAGMAAALCAQPDSWAPSPSWLMSEMGAGYAALSDDVTLPSKLRAHAAERLGMLYGHLGKDTDRAALMTRVLAWREAELGAESPELSHTVQVLANLLSSALGRHQEAEALMLRALRLTRLARDPKGREQLHLVAAAHGDLGSLYGRMRDWARATEQLSACLELEVQLWGPENAFSADTRFNLGLTAQLSGDKAGAKEHWTVALRSYERHSGMQHPSTERARTHLKQLHSTL